AAFVETHGPSMIKALAGGGGRGMGEVSDVADVDGVYQRCRREAATAFGNEAVYVERLIQAPHHIEVQIVGDGTGTVVQLGERDCTIQRRHQKVIEIAPSPALDPGVRQAILDAAVRLGESVSYAGLGTVEFLVSGDEFWFMEVNPRL